MSASSPGRLDGRKKTMAGGGAEVQLESPAPYIVKRAIAAELKRRGRPVAAKELHEVCPEGTTLEAVEYHLCTLGLMRVAKPVPRGPKLLFEFVGDPDGRWCRHLGLRGGVRHPH